MAIRKAVATGNWSDTATWDGGTIPGLNDTVYANGYTVTLDQAIDLTGSTVDQSGSFIPGQIYEIVSLGTTNFALTANAIVPGTNAGTATAVSSTVGTIFQAVNAGTATTGTAKRLGALLNYVNTPISVVTGGGFTMSGNYNVTGAYIQAGSANCLSFTSTVTSTLAGCRAIGSAFTLSTRAISFGSTGTLTLNGIIARGGSVAGSTVANGAHAVENTSSGTIAFTNASTINGGASLANGVLNTGTGTISVTNSSITGGVGNNAYGIINNNSFGNVSVIGSTILGGPSGGGNNSFCIQNNLNGSVTVTSSTIDGGFGGTAHGINNALAGSITAISCTISANSTSACYGINNLSTGSLVLSGDITAYNLAFGVNSTNAGAIVKISGSLIGSSNGTPAIYCPKYLIDPTPSVAKIRQGKNGTSTYSDFFTADNNLGQANPTDVRSGTVYASGSLTGTLAVPAVGSVALGIAVDNTTGTATLTAANVRAALGLASANLDTKLAVLSNLDTTVSSRLAPNGTLATVTTLTNAPASVTPAQIRAEMDTNSTKLTAIKSKTDLLNTDRLAQCATTSIVGSLIAQSNS